MQAPLLFIFYQCPFFHFVLATPFLPGLHAQQEHRYHGHQHSFPESPVCSCDPIVHWYDLHGAQVIHITEIKSPVGSILDLFAQPVTAFIFAHSIGSSAVLSNTDQSMSVWRTALQKRICCFCWWQVEHESAECPGSQKGQQYPGVNWAQHCQLGKGRVCPALLCAAQPLLRAVCRFECHNIRRT